jgi:hypothetical protein
MTEDEAVPYLVYEDSEPPTGLKIPCPTCEAEAWAWCRHLRDSELGFVHTTRVQKAAHSP